MKGTIFLVEDDAAVRTALTRLLEGEGLRVKACASAEEFLAKCPRRPSGCLLLDLRLPGKNGLDLQEELTLSGIRLPVVFLSGHGDVPASVRALKSGALDFLVKPAPADTLLHAVRKALDRDAERRRRDAAEKAAHARVAQLTPREREVMALTVAGHPNKEIARRLGISHRTVEVHRAHMLHKLGTKSLLELSRLASVCGLSSAAEETPLGSSLRVPT